MYPAVHLGSREWEVTLLVARHGPITLAQVASAMGLAKTSTRQQVDRLVSEGWLDRARRHGKRGRPVDIFSLSDRGRQLFARQMDELTRTLLQEITDADGKAKLRSVIQGVGRRMTRQLRPRIGEGTATDRVYRLSDVLNEGGTLSDVTPSQRGLTVTVHTCPYHGLSEERRVLCDMECKMVSRLVGAKTRLNHRIANGDPRCEFEVAVGTERPRQPLED